MSDQINDIHAKLEARDAEIRRLEQANKRLRSALSANKSGKRSLKRLLSLRTMGRIKRRGLFDEPYYIEQAGQRGIALTSNPLWHYISKGYYHGLNPHILFSTEWYLSENPDVLHSGMNPLIHYLKYGYKEGRDPHPIFNNEYYISKFEAEEFELISPLEHYLTSSENNSSSPSAQFDPIWYLQAYPDIAKSNLRPLEHYLRYGHKELRNPSLNFNEDWYKKSYINENEYLHSSLEHFVSKGFAQGNRVNATHGAFLPTEIDNSLRKTVLVVAHSVGEKIFGAEKSLIDVLSVIDRSQYRVILSIPRSIISYITLVQNYVDKVAIHKWEWWDARKKPSRFNEVFFENLMKSESVDLVYSNTIVSRTPSIIAKKLSIPTIVHVRELVHLDEALKTTIGIDADEIVKDVIDRNDVVIANSNFTSSFYEDSHKTIVIPNSVEANIGFISNKIDDDGLLKVGMLSSNIEKKGIADFVKLARIAKNLNLPVQFIAYGPKTEFVKKVLIEISKGKGPNNLKFPGYIDSVEQGIKSLNIVVNFSSFAESFGRTAIEGMMYSRPVIAYDHGALPEVIGNNGHIIPYKKSEAAIPHIKAFIENPNLLETMGQMGAAHVKGHYTSNILKANINSAFKTALEKPTNVEKAFENNVNQFNEQVLDAPKISVVIPNYNYEQFLPERLESILNQSYLPSEIIFLDDKSTDASVVTARRILKKQAEDHQIPFKIIRNRKNKGVYQQWLKGIKEAQYDWVWIAEADDSSAVNFLEKLCSRITPNTCLVYSQSKKIDEHSDEITPNNLAHTDDISQIKWLSDYTENGINEVCDALFYRNTIPNISAAIFNKKFLKDIDRELLKYKYAGDWFFYVYLLKNGSMSYLSEPLNMFRRHALGVTRQNSKSSDYLVELANIRNYMSNNYPILERQIPLANTFLDRDYKISRVKKNSTYTKIDAIMEQAKTAASKRKLVGIITTNNGSYTGGSEVLWRETALRLTQEGHRVIVLIKNWGAMPDVLSELQDSGIKFLFKEDNGFANLVDRRPDFVIVSTGDQDEGIEYYSKLAKNEIRYAIINQLTKEPRFWPIRPKKTPDVLSGYTGADAVFFTCENNQRVMEQRLDTKLQNSLIHFNPYHIDRDIVPDYPSTSDGYHVAIPSKLLFIHKGQDLILEMFKKYPIWAKRSITFNFYGDGSDRSTLETAFASETMDKCILHGRVDDIAEIWRTNHALLMPSRMEGMPIMIISAMLSSRTCIATDIGGHAEVIKSGQTGYIIPNPDVDALHETLELAYKERRNWKDMGALCRQDILNYLPEDPVSHFVDRLESLWA